MSDNGGYFTGNCDIMALALHRLTGHPFGLISGKVPDEDEEDGYFFEDAHAIVIVDAEKELWMDAAGLSSHIPDNVFFNNPVTEIVIRPATEEEIRSAFTCFPIEEEAIVAAMEYAIKHVFGGQAPQRQPLPQLEVGDDGKLKQPSAPKLSM